MSTALAPTRPPMDPANGVRRIERAPHDMSEAVTARDNLFVIAHLGVLRVSPRGVLRRRIRSRLRHSHSPASDRPRTSSRSRQQADLGRFSITGLESDRHVLRVPGLRNIAVTAPYFHNGRIASLEDAVKIMARNQLGRDLEAPDVDLIVKFLGALTGEYRGQLLTGGTDAQRQ